MAPSEAVRAARRPSRWRRLPVLLSVLLAVFLALHLVRSFVQLPRRLCLAQRCRMSRMWPSYVRVPLSSASPSGLDRKYTLRLYRERAPGTPGRPAHGAPVLFVPGNAGSFGQVRSVASMADELAHPDSGQAMREVDWYTIDFNEDFSAFHGATLLEQATYINEALLHLRSLSHGQLIPLLAHSMGGIAARLALLQPNHPHGSVDTLITLSSPHAYPPAPFDDSIESLYSALSSAARAEPVASNSASQVLLISLTGGLLDTQLPAEPASLDLARLWPAHARLTGFTSAMPALWSGVDHLAMMWCDQLRTRIARGVALDASVSRAGEEGLRRRRAHWAEMLGLPLPSPDSASMLGPERDVALDGLHNATGVQVYAVPLGSKHSFDLITSHIVAGQSAGLLVEVCQSSPDGHVRCRSVLPSAFGMLPPSPRLSHTTVSPSCAGSAFPIAEERYDAPGASLHRLSLPARLLSGDGERWVRVSERSSDGASSGRWHSGGWTRDASLITGSPWRPGGLMLPLEAIFSSPLIKVVAPSLDSSLLAYTLHLEPDPTCDASALMIAPLLRVSHRTTVDAALFPHLSPTPSIVLPLALHGTSPYMPASPTEGRGMLFELWAPTAADGPAKCARPFSGIRVTVDWQASAGLLLMRYRIALGILPLAVVLATAAASWQTWNDEGVFPSIVTQLLSTRSSGLRSLIAASLALSALQAALLALQGSDVPSSWLRDLSLGLSGVPLAFSLILGPLFLLIAHALVLCVALSLRAVVTSTVLALRAAGLTRFAQWSGPAPSRLQTKKGTWASIAALLLAVLGFLPYQFVYLVAFAMQLLAVVRSNASLVDDQPAYRALPDDAGRGKASSPEDSDDASDLRKPLASDDSFAASREAQHLLLLNIMAWLLPLKAPVLVVWVRNLLVGWRAPLGGADHNPLRVAAVLLLVQVVSSGRVLERAQSRLEGRITQAMFAACACYTLAWGPRHAYRIYTLANVLVAWLLLVHLRARRAGVSSPLPRADPLHLADRSVRTTDER